MAARTLYVGTAALSERDYVHDAIDLSDLIIAIGHDTVEKPPFLMRDKGGPKVIHVGYTSATVEQVFHPDAEVVGDIGATVTALADRLAGRARSRHIAARASADDPRAHQRAQPGGSFSDHAAAHRPRCQSRHARGRHRLPGQWHVQDLVRPQLPHPPRQHAAARQRAGDHGGRAAVGDRGVAALSASAASWRCAAMAAS